VNKNSIAIIILCSHLCDENNIKPYEPAEWSKLVKILSFQKLQPSDLLLFNDDDFKNKLNYTSYDIERIKKLIERSKNIFFELENYKKIGINVITRADNNYPSNLKKKLGDSCPPILYYIGNLKLLEKNAIGFVGSRNINAEDFIFTEKIVSKINKNGYLVVSGGAKGIDRSSSEISIKNGSGCIEYIACSILSKIENKIVMNSIINNKLLILSAVTPNENFTTGIAMMRNKFIYAHSVATVVVKSNYKKGGTWNGASQCLKEQITPVLCWNKSNYIGNLKLINLGAFAIDENWDGDISSYKLKKAKDIVQLSLFN